MENFKEIVKEILALNPKFKVSGSYALVCQGLKTARDIKDLDFFKPAGEAFVKPEGMRIIYDYNQEDYDNEWYERLHYDYKGINIDIFTPFDKDSELNLMTRYEYVIPAEILKFKLMFALGTSNSAQKHAADMKFIIAHNC